MAEIRNPYELEVYEQMPYVWVLDTSFRKIAIIEAYVSLIWSRRYYETGDFELYVEANTENLNLLRMGNYVTRSDYADEVFRIEKVEITTSGEEGDFITASGRDLRCIIYQRCTQFDYTYKSKDVPIQLETGIIRQIVYENFINTQSYPKEVTEIENTETGETEENPNSGLDRSKYNSAARKMPSYFDLGSSYGLDIPINSIQVPADNIGDLIEEWAKTYDFGWRVSFHRSGNSVYLRFECYRGVDRTSDVVFAEKFENLRDATYTYDRTTYFNAGRIKDDPEEGDPIDVSIGTASGMDRFEQPVDTEELTSGLFEEAQINEFIEMFGWDFEGGTLAQQYDGTSDTFGVGNISHYLNGYKLYLTGYDFPMYGDEMYENEIKSLYPDGTLITRNGVQYWHVTSNIPIQPKEKTGGSWFSGYNCTDIEVDEEDGLIQCRMRAKAAGFAWNKTSFPKLSNGKEYPASAVFYLPTSIRNAMIQDNAYAQMDVWMKDEKFEGSVETRSLYRYRKDYDIGDKVHIITDVGITEDVVITEAVETFDTNGYTVEVGFEK